MMGVFEVDDLEAARAVAEQYVGEGDGFLDLSAPPQEIASGWFFHADARFVGSNGIVVNKKTGRVLALGSAFPIERDLRFYDKGYQAKVYDLVVLAVNHLDTAVEHLVALELSVVSPEYEAGAVWRIPRTLSEADIRTRLADLPCVFGDQSLYFSLEELEQAEDDGSFEFTAMPRLPRTYE
ncbi:MAG: hypothetical protein ACR2NL_04990 [Acidimicrobiia bacterium]